MQRDTDDSYEPTEHVYEWEGELTTKNGSDWYLVVVVRETRGPMLVDGKLRSRSTYTLTDAQVFPCIRDTYADDALGGIDLDAWLVRYGTEVAAAVADRWHDAWVEWAESRADRH